MAARTSSTEGSRSDESLRSSLPSAESFEFVDDDSHVHEQSRTLLNQDIEKQSPLENVPPQSVTEGAEYLISTRTKLSFLGFYFALNLVGVMSATYEAE